MSELFFEIKPFQSLSLEELYAISALREAVFVVEQDCPYLDADGKDLKAYHLMGKDEKGQIQAYARILDKGISYAEYPSIGRIVTSMAIRGTGGGRALMLEAIKQTNRLYPGERVKISAQSYLQAFYESFGFEPTGASYLEDGIPHMAMIRMAD